MNQGLTPRPSPQPPVRKIKLVIAYDGAGYEGWQVQKIGRGVQEVIEEAVRKIFPTAGRLHGSSRTDTGVHALGMAAHLEIAEAEFNLPIAKLALALNAHLPDDVRIMEAEICPADFHARFDSRGKQYRYFVWNAPSMNPLLRFQAWHVPRQLQWAEMRAAAQVLVGKHDFASFAANRNYKMETTVRTLTRCDVRRKGAMFTFVIEGDGFLYKMCRGIVGTLVQAGQGKFTLDQVRGMLSHPDRRLGGMSAPAHGLVLWKVFYPPKNSPRPSAHARRPR